MKNSNTNYNNNHTKKGVNREHHQPRLSQLGSGQSPSTFSNSQKTQESHIDKFEHRDPKDIETDVCGAEDVLITSTSPILGERHPAKYNFSRLVTIRKTTKKRTPKTTKRGRGPRISLLRIQQHSLEDTNAVESDEEEEFDPANSSGSETDLSSVRSLNTLQDDASSISDNNKRIYNDFELLCRMSKPDVLNCRIGQPRLTKSWN